MSTTLEVFKRMYAVADELLELGTTPKNGLKGSMKELMISKSRELRSIAQSLPDVPEGEPIRPQSSLSEFSDGLTEVQDCDKCPDECPDAN